MTMSERVSDERLPFDSPDAAPLLDTASPPKLTVLIITFNHAAFIEQAIASVMMQKTSFPFEVIVADDASTDGAREILLGLRERFPQTIRLFAPERNMGQMGNGIFRAALPMCRGEYVAFLDGDDYWTAPDKLQRQIDFLDYYREYIGVFHLVEVLDDEASVVSGVFPAIPVKRHYSLDDFIEGTFVPFSSVVYRNQLAGAMPEWVFETPYSDWGFHAVHAACAPLALIAERLAVYRRHQGGVWSRLDGVAKLQVLIAQTARIPERFPSANRALVRRTLALQWIELAIKYRSSARYGAAAAAIYRAFRSDWSPSIWYALLRRWLATIAPARLLAVFRRAGQS
jgi:hypothetical protein